MPDIWQDGLRPECPVNLKEKIVDAKVAIMKPFDRFSYTENEKMELKEVLVPTFLSDHHVLARRKSLRDTVQTINLGDNKAKLVEQGDVGFYTDDNQRVREVLRWQPDLLRVVGSWWYSALLIDDLDRDGVLSKDEYFAFYSRLFKAFKCHTQDDVDGMRESWLSDWETDRGGHDHIDKRRFQGALFQLADMWVDSTDLDEYIDFLDELYPKVFPFLANKVGPGQDIIKDDISATVGSTDINGNGGGEVGNRGRNIASHPKAVETSTTVGDGNVEVGISSASASTAEADSGQDLVAEAVGRRIRRARSEQRKRDRSLQFRSIGQYRVERSSVTQLQRGYPHVMEVTATSFTLAIQFSSLVGDFVAVHYVVQLFGAYHPAPDEVLAGIGGGGGGIMSAATFIITRKDLSTPETVTITGLSPGLSYDIYMVVEDGRYPTVSHAALKAAVALGRRKSRGYENRQRRSPANRSPSISAGGSNSHSSRVDSSRRSRSIATMTKPVSKHEWGKDDIHVLFSAAVAEATTATENQGTNVEVGEKEVLNLSQVAGMDSRSIDSASAEVTAEKYSASPIDTSVAAARADRGAAIAAVSTGTNSSCVTTPREKRVNPSGRKRRHSYASGKSQSLNESRGRRRSLSPSQEFPSLAVRPRSQPFVSGAGSVPRSGSVGTRPGAGRRGSTNINTKSISRGFELEIDQAWRSLAMMDVLCCTATCLDYIQGGGEEQGGASATGLIVVPPSRTAIMTEAEGGYEKEHSPRPSSCNGGGGVNATGAEAEEALYRQVQSTGSQHDQRTSLSEELGDTLTVKQGVSKVNHYQQREVEQAFENEGGVQYNPAPDRSSSKGCHASASVYPQACSDQGESTVFKDSGIGNGSEKNPTSTVLGQWQRSNKTEVEAEAAKVKPFSRVSPAPSFSPGYPFLTNVTATGFEVSTRVCVPREQDEELHQKQQHQHLEVPRRGDMAMLYYMVVHIEAGAPSIEEVQMGEYMTPGVGGSGKKKQCSPNLNPMERNGIGESTKSARGDAAVDSDTELGRSVSLRGEKEIPKGEARKEVPQEQVKAKATRGIKGVEDADGDGGKDAAMEAWSKALENSYQRVENAYGVDSVHQDQRVVASGQLSLSRDTAPSSIWAADIQSMVRTLRVDNSQVQQGTLYAVYLTTSHFPRTAGMEETLVGFSGANDIEVGYKSDVNTTLNRSNDGGKHAPSRDENGGEEHEAAFITKICVRTAGQIGRLSVHDRQLLQAEGEGKGGYSPHQKPWLSPTHRSYVPQEVMELRRVRRERREKARAARAEFERRERKRGRQERARVQQLRAKELSSVGATTGGGELALEETYTETQKSGYVPTSQVDDSEYTKFESESEDEEDDHDYGNFWEWSESPWADVDLESSTEGETEPAPVASEVEAPSSDIRGGGGGGSLDGVDFGSSASARTTVRDVTGTSEGGEDEGGESAGISHGGGEAGDATTEGGEKNEAAFGTEAETGTGVRESGASSSGASGSGAASGQLGYTGETGSASQTSTTKRLNTKGEERTMSFLVKKSSWSKTMGDVEGEVKVHGVGVRARRRGPIQSREALVRAHVKRHSRSKPPAFGEGYPHTDTSLDDTKVINSPLGSAGGEVGFVEGGVDGNVNVNGVQVLVQLKQSGELYLVALPDTAVEPTPEEIMSGHGFGGSSPVCSAHLHISEAYAEYDLLLQLPRPPPPPHYFPLAQGVTNNQQLQDIGGGSGGRVGMGGGTGRYNVYFVTAAESPKPVGRGWRGGLRRRNPTILVNSVNGYKVSHTRRLSLRRLPELPSDISLHQRGGASVDRDEDSSKYSNGEVETDAEDKVRPGFSRGMGEKESGGAPEVAVGPNPTAVVPTKSSSIRKKIPSSYSGHPHSSPINRDGKEGLSAREVFVAGYPHISRVTSEGTSVVLRLQRPARIYFGLLALAHDGHSPGTGKQEIDGGVDTTKMGAGAGTRPRTGAGSGVVDGGTNGSKKGGGEESGEGAALWGTKGTRNLRTVWPTVPANSIRVGGRRKAGSLPKFYLSISGGGDRAVKRADFINEVGGTKSPHRAYSQDGSKNGGLTGWGTDEWDDGGQTMAVGSAASAASVEGGISLSSPSVSVKRRVTLAVPQLRAPGKDLSQTGLLTPRGSPVSQQQQQGRDGQNSPPSSSTSTSTSTSTTSPRRSDNTISTKGSQNSASGISPRTPPLTRSRSMKRLGGVKPRKLSRSASQIRGLGAQIQADVGGGTGRGRFGGLDFGAKTREDGGGSHGGGAVMEAWGTRDVTVLNHDVVLTFEPKTLQPDRMYRLIFVWDLILPSRVSGSNGDGSDVCRQDEKLGSDKVQLFPCSGVEQLMMRIEGVGPSPLSDSKRLSPSSEISVDPVQAARVGRGRGSSTIEGKRTVSDTGRNGGGGGTKNMQPKQAERPKKQQRGRRESHLYKTLTCDSMSVQFPKIKEGRTSATAVEAAVEAARERAVSTKKESASIAAQVATSTIVAAITDTINSNEAAAAAAKAASVLGRGNVSNKGHVTVGGSKSTTSVEEGKHWDGAQYHEMVFCKGAVRQSGRSVRIGDILGMGRTPTTMGSALSVPQDFFATPPSDNYGPFQIGQKDGAVTRPDVDPPIVSPTRKCLLPYRQEKVQACVEVTRKKGSRLGGQQLTTQQQFQRKLRPQNVRERQKKKQVVLKERDARTELQKCHQKISYEKVEERKMELSQVLGQQARPQVHLPEQDRDSELEQKQEPPSRFMEAHLRHHRHTNEQRQQQKRQQQGRQVAASLAAPICAALISPQSGDYKKQQPQQRQPHSSLCDNILMTQSPKPIEKSDYGSTGASATTPPPLSLHLPSKSLPPVSMSASSTTPCRVAESSSTAIPASPEPSPGNRGGTVTGTVPVARSGGPGEGEVSGQQQNMEEIPPSLSAGYAPIVSGFSPHGNGVAGVAGESVGGTGKGGKPGEGASALFVGGYIGVPQDKVTYGIGAEGRSQRASDATLGLDVGEAASGETAAVAAMAAAAPWQFIAPSDMIYPQLHTSAHPFYFNARQSNPLVMLPPEVAARSSAGVTPVGPVTAQITTVATATVATAATRTSSPSSTASSPAVPIPAHPTIPFTSHPIYFTDPLLGSHRGNIGTGSNHRQEQCPPPLQYQYQSPSNSNGTGSFPPPLSGLAKWSRPQPPFAPVTAARPPSNGFGAGVGSGKGAPVSPPHYDIQFDGTPAALPTSPAFGLGHLWPSPESPQPPLPFPVISLPSSDAASSSTPLSTVSGPVVTTFVSSSVGVETDDHGATTEFPPSGSPEESSHRRRGGGYDYYGCARSRGQARRLAITGTKGGGSAEVVEMEVKGVAGAGPGTGTRTGDKKELVRVESWGWDEGTPLGGGIDFSNAANKNPNAVNSGCNGDQVGHKRSRGASRRKSRSRQCSRDGIYVSSKDDCCRRGDRQGSTGGGNSRKVSRIRERGSDGTNSTAPLEAAHSLRDVEDALKDKDYILLPGPSNPNDNLAPQLTAEKVIQSSATSNKPSGNSKTVFNAVVKQRPKPARQPLCMSQSPSFTSPPFKSASALSAFVSPGTVLPPNLPELSPAFPTKGLATLPSVSPIKFSRLPSPSSISNSTSSLNPGLNNFKGSMETISKLGQKCVLRSKGCHTQRQASLLSSHHVHGLGQTQGSGLERRPQKAPLLLPRLVLFVRAEEGEKALSMTSRNKLVTTTLSLAQLLQEQGHGLRSSGFFVEDLFRCDLNFPSSLSQFFSASTAMSSSYSSMFSMPAYSTSSSAAAAITASRGGGSSSAVAVLSSLWFALAARAMVDLDLVSVHSFVAADGTAVNSLRSLAQAAGGGDKVQLWVQGAARRYAVYSTVAVRAGGSSGTVISPLSGIHSSGAGGIHRRSSIDSRLRPGTRQRSGRGGGHGRLRASWSRRGPSHGLKNSRKIASRESLECSSLAAQCSSYPTDVLLAEQEEEVHDSIQKSHVSSGNGSCSPLNPEVDFATPGPARTVNFEPHPTISHDNDQEAAAGPPIMEAYATAFAHLYATQYVYQQVQYRLRQIELNSQVQTKRKSAGAAGLGCNKKRQKHGMEMEAGIAGFGVGGRGESAAEFSAAYQHAYTYIRSHGIVAAGVIPGPEDSVDAAKERASRKATQRKRAIIARATWEKRNGKSSKIACGGVDEGGRECDVSAGTQGGGGDAYEDEVGGVTMRMRRWGKEGVDWGKRIEGEEEKRTEFVARQKRRTQRNLEARAEVKDGEEVDDEDRVVIRRGGLSVSLQTSVGKCEDEEVNATSVLPPESVLIGSFNSTGTGLNAVASFPSSSSNSSISSQSLFPSPSSLCATQSELRIYPGNESDVARQLGAAVRTIQNSAIGHSRQNGTGTDTDRGDGGEVNCRGSGVKTEGNGTHGLRNSSPGGVVICLRAHEADGRVGLDPAALAAVAAALGSTTETPDNTDSHSIYMKNTYPSHSHDGTLMTLSAPRVLAYLNEALQLNLSNPSAAAAALEAFPERFSPCGRGGGSVRGAARIREMGDGHGAEPHWNGQQAMDPPPDKCLVGGEEVHVKLPRLEHGRAVTAMDPARVVAPRVARVGGAKQWAAFPNHPACKESGIEIGQSPREWQAQQRRRRQRQDAAPAGMMVNPDGVVVDQLRPVPTMAEMHTRAPAAAAAKLGGTGHVAQLKQWQLEGGKQKHTTLPPLLTKALESAGGSTMSSTADDISRNLDSGGVVGSSIRSRAENAATLHSSDLVPDDLDRWSDIDGWDDDEIHKDYRESLVGFVGQFGSRVHPLGSDGGGMADEET